MAGEQVTFWPARGTNATLAAFNPNTGLVYLNAWHKARIMKFIEPKLVMGGSYTGVETTFTTPAGEPQGHHKALNPLTGKEVWSVPFFDAVNSAGMLATDGGLLFTGKLTGEFIALDMENGKPLWQFKTGSGINAAPITYTHKGVQYVTILSGIGGSNPNRFAGRMIAPGGSVWTFALMSE